MVIPFLVWPFYIGKAWFDLDFIQNVLGTALQPRDGAYMLIVKLNFANDVYEPIRVPDSEWMNMGFDKECKISAWFDALGKSPIIHNLDKERFKEFASIEKMKECFLHGEKYPTFIHRRIKDDEYVLAVSVLEASEDYTVDNQEVFLYVIDIDHIYFRAYADVIQRLGEKDYKTGAYSRNAFDMELIKVSRIGKLIGVVYADINGLRYVNNNYGRETGDKIIRDFSDWLLRTFPAAKYKCYRVCGEEFAVIAEGLDYNTAKSFDEMVAKIKESLWLDRPLACLGHAIGYGIDVGPLLDQAESKMYEEKKKFYDMYPKLNV